MKKLPNAENFNLDNPEDAKEFAKQMSEYHSSQSEKVADIEAGLSESNLKFEEELKAINESISDIKYKNNKVSDKKPKSSKPNIDLDAKFSEFSHAFHDKKLGRKNKFVTWLNNSIDDDDDKFSESDIYNHFSTKSITTSTTPEVMEDEASNLIETRSLTASKLLDSMGRLSANGNTDFFMRVTNNNAKAGTTEEWYEGRSILPTDTMSFYNAYYRGTKFYSQFGTSDEAGAQAAIPVTVENIRSCYATIDNAAEEDFLFGEAKLSDSSKVTGARGLCRDAIDYENDFAESLKSDDERSPDYFHVKKSGVAGNYKKDSEGNYDWTEILDQVQEAIDSVSDVLCPNKIIYMNKKTWRVFRKATDMLGRPLIKSDNQKDNEKYLLGCQVVQFENMYDPTFSPSGDTPFADKEVAFFVGDLEVATKRDVIEPHQHTESISNPGADTTYLDVYHMYGISERRALTAFVLAA